MKKMVAVVLCLVMIMSFGVSAGAVSQRYGFLYDRIDNSDVLEIVGIVSDGELADAQTINIPYSIRGLTVIQIGQSALMDNTTVENVNLTEKILQISDNAMYGMKALKSMVLPENLTILGKSAFSHCSSLKTVTFDTEKLLQIQDFTFYGCTQLNDVVLPDSVFEIGEYAFAQCMSLDNIYIPPTVSIIADTAFYSTKNGFTIYGYKGSYAYRYALNKNIPFVDMKEKTFAELDEMIVQAENQMAVSFRYTESSVNDLEQAIRQAKTVQNNSSSTEEQAKNTMANLESRINALVRITESDTRAVLKGCSLSLEGDIGLNFYVELDSSVVDSETAYVQFTIPKGDNTEIKKVYIKDATLKSSMGENYYSFKCRVAPKEMNLRVKAQFFDNGNGGTEYTYSVKNYADYILAHTENWQYAQAEEIVKAMLNYGAYSQSYFDDETETLVNENLTETEKDVSDVTAQTINKPYDKTTQNHLFEGVTFAGATVSLKSETTLSLYFQSEETLSFSCQGKILSTTKKDGYQIVRINGIPAKEIGNDFTVTVTAGENSGTVIYSPLNYCYNVLNDNQNSEKFQNAVKALYKYWQCADVYFL
ncbi:MAG: leucine-rich repeat domain-containing protein [Clostridia bacterium]|nr:leucine-rich repeat domain-containing protein [Clostridia bacterium]